MKIEELRIGLNVTCPEDRGCASYKAKIIDFSKEIEYNFNKSPYVWVYVENIITGHKSSWASVRLSY